MVSVRANEIRRLSVDEYHRMADTGLFADERVELLEGVIVSIGPQKSPHAYAVGRLNKILTEAVARRPLTVRPQLPLTLSDRSEPEPDLAVVTDRSIVDAHPRHPGTALLVVEVADATVRKDRSKAALYAAAGVPEYWLVNLPRRCVEVMRGPDGARYRRHQVVTRGTLRCSGLPRLALDVPSLWIK